MAQSLKEWTGECEIPIRPFAECSNETPRKPIGSENPRAYDLAVPPTTDPEHLVAAGVAVLPVDMTTVAFFIDESIQMFADMQAKAGYGLRPGHLRRGAPGRGRSQR